MKTQTATSADFQQRLDGSLDLLRRVHRAVALDHFAALVDQELREVPLDALCAQHAWRGGLQVLVERSEEHTSELQSLMRISYAVFCLKKKKKINRNTKHFSISNNI